MIEPKATPSRLQLLAMPDPFHVEATCFLINLDAALQLAGCKPSRNRSHRVKKKLLGATDVTEH